MKAIQNHHWGLFSCYDGDPLLNSLETATKVYSVYRCSQLRGSSSGVLSEDLEDGEGVCKVFRV